MNIATAILFYSFITSCVVLLFYYINFFLKLSKESQQKTEGNLPPISIVIAARNESKNLTKNIPIFLTQDYPDFEVVVVNDDSKDNTDEIMHAMMKEHDNLEVTHINSTQKTFSGKKLPLTLGIKKAKYERIIFTDADCFPKSNQWLKTMARSYDKDFVIGYSPYAKTKGLLNSIIRFDAVQIGLQYLSFAKAGLPYMGVGRNLGYRKEKFFSVGGFRSQYHIPSGDDDLFVNQFIKKDNYRIEYDQASFIYSEPNRTWPGWWKQKRRHLSTANYYKFSTKFLLGTYHLAQIVFYLSLILLLVNHISIIVVLSLFLGKTIIQLLISSRAFPKLEGRDLVALIPIYEPVLLILGILVTVSLRFSKNIKWK